MFFYRFLKKERYVPHLLLLQTHIPNITSIKINHQTKQSILYEVSTSTKLFHAHVIFFEKLFHTEKVVLDRCKAEDIPVAEIIVEEIQTLDSTPIYLRLMEIKGTPIRTKKLHIFDYNAILDHLTKILYTLHQIHPKKFGLLGPNFYGYFNSWPEMLKNDLDIKIHSLEKNAIISPTQKRKLKKILQFPQNTFLPSLIHNNLSSNTIFVNSENTISTVSNFFSPVAGHPYYEFVNYYLCEGEDRTKRLMRRYQALDASIDFFSKEFRQYIILRYIHLIFSKLSQNRSRNDVKNLQLQFISLFN